ncbi:ATP-dependent Clp protease proteolytic subunit [Bradyrhizobium sp. 41S5]|uniref:ATP-dependent Clp protease proteolytic subunit n=1 Tax=Bradyrhizobium sp. 41S5 TaxID=1404443 RepID=UPI001E51BA67|nr:ATP-dependent Clp protease proteolytic subunit [Bradyrhizobium sp. 41S5]UFX41717.1 ATP-dependent Clp protease proteolytic subunit [Bradyrhizobium sp. 41S5]
MSATLAEGRGTLLEMPGPMSQAVYVVTAGPRKLTKLLPVFPNPSRRPDGAEPALVLDLMSEVPSGVDIALGRAPKRDTGHFLRAIREAGDRNIHCRIDCAGGEGDSALAIAIALLQHPYRVTADITGRCSSGAVLIALAADQRSIVPNGSVLIHKAARVYVGSQFVAMCRLSATDKDAISDSLNDSDDATEALLTSRLGVSREVARGWMSEDRKWSATEALANGFVSVVEAA